MDTDTQTPVVLVAPAMGAPSAYYRPVVEAFEARGWGARALPAPGVDRDTEPPRRGHDWGYDHLVDQMDRVASEVREHEPGRPLVVLGHSLGGHVAMAWSQRGGKPDGLALVGSPVPWFGFYRYGLIGLLGGVVPVVTRVAGLWPDGLFAGAQPASLMQQWAGFVRTGRLPHAPGARRDGSLEVPTLVVQIEGDTLATDAGTAAMGRYVRPDLVTTWRHTRAGSPSPETVDHLRWAKRPQPVVDRVVTWWTDTRHLRR
ncbi:alpha/beta fold hydrolase [Solicola sp. PLA-1-18]|uniref:alpha/beta fold hydrolase n=1 Tax=Solicola sp. PLA-1-18 TaxID=3380532 RepID=UPI003B7B8B22